MFGDLSSGAKHLVRGLAKNGSHALKSGMLAVDDLRQASMFLGNQIAVLTGPKGMRALAGTANGIPKSWIRPGEKILIHTHPFFFSQRSHFDWDVSKASSHIEAVVDWGGNITYFNNRGVIYPTVGPINSKGFVTDSIIGYY